MRIDYFSFLILSPYLINFVKGSCLLSELKGFKIDHFEKWVCNAVTNQDAVPNGARCALVCQEDYIPAARKFRSLHKCGMNGWKKPEKFNMFCEYSANKLEEDVLQYWRNHFSYDAIKRIKDPSLQNNYTNADGSITGVYWFSVNQNFGYMCNRYQTITQHAANLLCQSVGLSEASSGGWFPKDPKPIPRNIPIQITHVRCDENTTSVITDCQSVGWGKGQGDFLGCMYKDVLNLTCLK